MELRSLADLAGSGVSDHPDGSFVLDELSFFGESAVFTLSSLVLVGLVVGGGIWSCCLLAILVLNAASCSTRFAVLFSLFSVLSFGRSSWHCSAPLLSCFSYSGWSRWL